ncbi:hypothetical protein SPONN_996 [uncultured Candidatus Thioglobus sp.]|nr:hypothetical protein SPONN_996 [uncultured Candidatus Thioglobus sp.]
MPSNKHIDKTLLVLFGIALGFFIGVYNYTPFEFQKIINIVINPSILITVLLAIYVTRVLTQQNEK